MMAWIGRLDNAIFHWINADWSNSLFDLIMPWITHLADSAIVWPWIIGIGVLAGRQFSRSEKSEIAGRRKMIFKVGYFFAIYAALIYLAASGLACKGLKVLISRPRPFVSQQVILRTSSIVTSHPYSHRSFPSGHSCNAFLVAAILAERLKRKRWMFYGAASLVALSRIYLGVHFPADVIAGALLGWGVARMMLSFRPLRERITGEGIGEGPVIGDR